MYHLQIYRQPWPNEAQREKVLAEKHARGNEARYKELLQRYNVEANVLNILKILIALNNLGSGADLRS